MAADFRRAFRLDRSSRADAKSAVDEELAFHLQEMEQEMVHAGWAPDEARREALRRFGDVDDARAYCEAVQTRRGREEGRPMSIDELRSDVRYAMRTLRKAPGYAALVVATLAFGVAANTTMFSAMRPYLLRPLPYGDADELVQVNQADPITGWDMDRFSYPQVRDWTERSRAFEAAGAYSYGVANLTGAVGGSDAGPEQVQYAPVTANLFADVLRSAPLLGRTFDASEGTPGGEPVVMLGETLWRRRYGADPGVLGKPITLDGVQHTVVGVMPEGFVFPFGGVRLWVPVQDDPVSNRQAMNLQIVARLNDGWTAERTRAELTGIQAELAARFPEADGRKAGVTVKPLREALNFAWDVLSISFRVLLGAVGFVLLIACVNVASLTLARGSGRSREVAVRAAMGAPRQRLIRQLLTESLVLALAGGTLGVLLSVWITGLIDPVIPEDIYRVGHIRVDGAVLAFSLLVTLVTPIAFGLWPALAASRANLVDGLKEGSKGSGGLAGSRGRRALVVAQVALAVVLISGAGLMLRSLRSVQDISLGFDAPRVVVSEVTLPSGSYASADERLDFVERAVAELRRTPGVSQASAVSWLPLNHETNTWQVAPSERAGAPAEEWPLAVLNNAHLDYFETMGIARVDGRTFTREDAADGTPVVVVSRSLARRFWPDGSPLGRTLLGGDDPADPTAYRVVGVVEDVRHEDLAGGGSGLQVYRPTLQSTGRRFFVLARTDRRPADLVGPVREALLKIDPALPSTVRPMTAVVAENQLQWTIGSTFLAAFGAGALLLATLGIYGLIAYAVAQRRRELGVRIALGATRHEIRRVVVSDGVRLALIGLVIGLVLAAGLARVTASALYGVGPFDPVTLGGVAVLFVIVAVVASVVPAERASRTDPVGVLRGE